MTRGRDEDGKDNGGSEMTFVLSAFMNSLENLRKRACNQKLSTVIITHDDLAFSNNSEPEAPSPVPSVRASSSSSGHCGASRSNCCALQKTVKESSWRGSMALAVSLLHIDFDYCT